MDERILHLYEQELRHLRETAREFGRSFPSMAPGLAVNQNPADPYVERLLEGTAFMAARIRLKLDAQFPQFTQGLLETIYPDFLAPVPSVTIVRLRPSPASPPPPAGSLVKRGSRIRGVPRLDTGLGRQRGEPTPCIFSLAHDVRLLPVELLGAELLTRRLNETGADRDFGARAALRLRLRKTAAAPWREFALDPLVLHLPAGDGLGFEILEHVFAHQLGIAVRDGSQASAKTVFVRKGRWARKVGFDAQTALLPSSPSTFEGYRLLREYFALPDRFLFFELRGFQEALAPCAGEVIELVLPLREASTRLEREVSTSSVELFCAPAINLFTKQFSQVIEPDRFSEFHVVPDVNRPLDFEIHSLEKVEGFSDFSPNGYPFLPFYKTRYRDRGGAAFFSVMRQERLLTERERNSNEEVPYAGAEVFLSLVDTRHAPFDGSLHQLGLVARCTNRHLPVLLREGGGVWTLDGGVKAAVDILVDPTVPRFRAVDGEYAWQILSLFSVNFLSLADTKGGDASALRELLSLYAGEGLEWTKRQIDALRRVQTATVSRPLFSEAEPDGPPRMTALGRGLEVTIEFEDEAWRDRRLFLLSAILDEFFAKYVTLNSFTETVVKTWPSGREWMRWPYRLGMRAEL